MKDGIILALLAVIALLAIGRDDRPEAQIEDVSAAPVHRAALHQADLPAWQPPAGDDSRLFATCPVTPWALPHQVPEHQA
jgi:hypothetical protein